LSNDQIKLPALDFAAWSSGVADETNWWSEWMETRGSEWPLEYADRLNPSYPLQSYVADTIDAPPGSTIRILDVGAGPLSVLGKVFDQYIIELTPTDLLADAYNKILDRANVIPPVRTLRCSTELLPSMFSAGYFDIAHARNTLDHSYDPLLCIREMTKSVRQGGTVILVHHNDEAEHVSYEGLHQWNFHSKADDLVIWRPGSEFSVVEVFKEDLTLRSIEVLDNLSVVCFSRTS
jgi:SAM-dependent methyltransferase